MKLIHGLIIVFSFIGCINKLPEEVKAGEHKCESCRMGIVSQNYHSQFITAKGRRYHFDSIECMFSYLNHNNIKTEKIWVKNYSNPKEWIEIQHAMFLKSEKLPSPMAANLSSYLSMSEAEANRKLYGGLIMTPEEVKTYIELNWEQEIAQKKE